MRPQSTPFSRPHELFAPRKGIASLRTESQVIPVCLLTSCSSVVPDAPLQPCLGSCPASPSPHSRRPRPTPRLKLPYTDIWPQNTDDMDQYKRLCLRAHRAWGPVHLSRPTAPPACLLERPAGLQNLTSSKWNRRFPCGPHPVSPPQQGAALSSPERFSPKTWGRRNRPPLLALHTQSVGGRRGSTLSVGMGDESERPRHFRLSPKPQAGPSGSLPRHPDGLGTRAARPEHRHVESS